VVGDVETDALKETLEDLFGDWQQGEIPDKRLAATTNRGRRVLYLLDRPGAEQSVIFTGQLIPPKNNPEELAIQAMNDVLGGQSAARINMNLREDKGWSYGAYSFILDARGERPLLAYAPVQTDKTADAIREMLGEFTRIVGDAPATEAELDRVVRTNTLSLPGRWESGGAVLSSLNEIVRYGLPDDYWDGYAERVENVSLDDVQRAAGDVLAPDSLYWVVVGDRSAIEADLAGLGFDEIRLLDTDGNPLNEQSAAR
jgi:zinc protease